MDTTANPSPLASWLALLDPKAHGFPSDPRLRLPILAWIKRDPSPEAQAEAIEVMGWPDLVTTGSKA
jgi:hypothetical protein